MAFSVTALFPQSGFSDLDEETLTGGNKTETRRLIMKSEMQKKLEQIAYNRTTSFCYGCYNIKAPQGICPECHSDDLMRHF